MGAGNRIGTTTRPIKCDRDVNELVASGLMVLWVVRPLPGKKINWYMVTPAGQLAARDLFTITGNAP